MWVSTVPPSLL